jgi:hypothetical protein
MQLVSVALATFCAARRPLLSGQAFPVGETTYAIPLMGGRIMTHFSTMLEQRRKGLSISITHWRLPLGANDEPSSIILFLPVVNRA